MRVGRVEQFTKSGPRVLYDCDGAAVLRDVENFIARFVVLPRGALLPVALWAFATYIFESFDTFSFLSITSPTPRCGKSRLLEVLGLLCWNAISASNISEAALFRTIAEDKPTLLLDEAEWLREKSERAQIFRNLLNAGHRSIAVAIRCEKDGTRKRFSVFCPKAIASIGELSETLRDRSIRIAMQRRAANEPVSRFIFSRAKVDGDALGGRIAAWLANHKHEIVETYRALPDLVFLDDRASDNWSSLFAVVSVLDSSRLPELRESAGSLSAERAELSSEDSLPLRLLSDFAAIAAQRTEKVIPTSILIEQARKIEEAPWAGEIELTPRKAARWLRGFGLRPMQARIETEKVRGYERQAIAGAASRYLISTPSGTSEASGTNNSFKHLRVPLVPDVPDGQQEGDGDGAE